MSVLDMFGGDRLGRIERDVASIRRDLAAHIHDHLDQAEQKLTEARRNLWALIGTAVAAVASLGTLGTFLVMYGTHH